MSVLTIRRMSSILLALLVTTTRAFTPSPPQQQQYHVRSTTLAATSPLFGLAAHQSKRKQSANDSMFAIPAIFNSADARPVVLFDGKCNLCNAGVQLVLDTDRADVDTRGNLRVAALQSRVGQILLSRLPEQQRWKVQTSMGGEYKSIVVAGPTTTHLNSNACVFIGKQLKGPLRWLARLVSIVPSFVRDLLYNVLSRYRKKFFGETADCRLWDDNWDTRFIDDGIFGGRSESDTDPFADPSLAKVVDEVDVEHAFPPKEGDVVRVVSDQPIVHTHVDGYQMGLCSVGLVGKVTRVLNPKAYPKSVAVKFDLEGGDVFEAHFYPGQLRTE